MISPRTNQSAPMIISRKTLPIAFLLSESETSDPVVKSSVSERFGGNRTKSIPHILQRGQCNSSFSKHHPLSIKNHRLHIDSGFLSRFVFSEPTAQQQVGVLTDRSVPATFPFVLRGRAAKNRYNVITNRPACHTGCGPFLPVAFSL